MVASVTSFYHRCKNYYICGRYYICGCNRHIQKNKFRLICVIGFCMYAYMYLHVHVIHDTHFLIFLSNWKTIFYLTDNVKMNFFLIKHQHPYAFVSCHALLFILIILGGYRKGMMYSFLFLETSLLCWKWNLNHDACACFWDHMGWSTTKTAK